MQGEHSILPLEAASTDSISTESTSTSTVSTTTVQTSGCPLQQLSDEQLLAQTRQLVGHSNRVLAGLLAHLAEVEARGVHRIRACSSLYTYCIYELRFSEDEAARRVSAARLVKRFPALLVAVERGELHLTGLLMLGPHLTLENHCEVFARAKHRTKKEIQKLVRELCPLPEVPACIEPLGPVSSGAHGVSPSWEAWVQSLCPVRELEPGDRPADWLGAMANEVESGDRAAALLGVPAPARIDSASVGVPAPARIDSARIELRSEDATRKPYGSALGPRRYRVQFNAGEEYVGLVERARALLSHAAPNAALEGLHLRAMRALVVELEKRRYAITESPRHAPDPVNSTLDPARTATTAGQESEAGSLDDTTRPARPGRERQRSRSVPAEVRRAVFERDEGCCTYVDDRGQRCRETHRLELHHVEPFAFGGAHRATNLALRCTAHNALAAEEDFGRSFIRQRQDGARHESAAKQT